MSLRLQKVVAGVAVSCGTLIGSWAKPPLLEQEHGDAEFGVLAENHVL